MTEWRPIETAPKDGTRICLWGHEAGDGGDDRLVIGYYEPEIGSTSCNGEAYQNWWSEHEQTMTGHDEDGYWMTRKAIIPTHWMPLLKPPKS